MFYTSLFLLILGLIKAYSLALPKNFQRFISIARIPFFNLQQGSNEFIEQVFHLFECLILFANFKSLDLNTI